VRSLNNLSFPVFVCAQIRDRFAIRNEKLRVFERRITSARIADNSVVNMRDRDYAQCSSLTRSIRYQFIVVILCATCG